MSRDVLADMLAVMGLLLLAVAAGLVFVPAGVAVLGVGLIAGAVALSREGGR